MGPRILLWLCIAVTLRSANCTTKNSSTSKGLGLRRTSPQTPSLNPGGSRDTADDEKAKLPELLTELDLASLEASEEDIDALRKVVKRLAPAKNGEYQVFQVFFGNEELLKEWLSGAGLGQPGVDFPMLTTIPTTSFSCRGLKGGYYADLETNCQVFHICDNGRKISFLCPNGTIFQQSQLICDWWFKVDCSKSEELYEQSAEHLAQEEKKRADLKRMNSEFRRNDHDNYEKSNYDGKQNARTNPYGQINKNQLTINEQRSSDIKSPSRPFDPTQIYNPNTRTGNQFAQINDLALNNGFATSQETNVRQNDNYNVQQQTRGSNYQNIDRQQNQLIDDRNIKQQSNYEQRGANKFSSQTENHHTTISSRDNIRSTKSRTVTIKDDDGTTNRATSAYTETTTFRTSTPPPPLPPVKEFQQPAESAAFASSRGNRYNNKPYNSNQFNSYYNVNIQNLQNSRRTTTSTTTTQKPFRQETPQNILKPRGRIPEFPLPTYAPIYRPRTNNYESTTLTTYSPYTSTNYDNGERTTNWDQTTTNIYTTGGDYRTTTETIYPDDTTGTYQGTRITTNYNTDSGMTDYTATTQNPGETTNYGNTETFSDNNVDNRDYSRVSHTSPSYPNTQRVGHYTSGSTTGGFTTSYSTPVTKSVTSDVTVDQNSLSTRRQDERLMKGRTTPWKSTVRSSQNYRQNSISPSTEKPSRITPVPIVPQNSKTSRPYESSITYKNGRVSTSLPYVPFTKNYAYTTTTSTTTTHRPPVYTATVPTYTTSSQFRSATKSPVRIPYQSVTVSNRPRNSAYLPEVNSSVKNQTKSKSLLEREHAFRMLETLKGLEGTVPTIIGNTSRNGLNIPHSSSPATLHSLALYFATASDEFKGSEQHRRDESTDPTEDKSKNDKSIDLNTTVNLPTSILTEHTINSYTELFNLNNALEPNPNSTESEDNGEEDDTSDDLDLQQSEGPVTGSRKANGTKLRELAQVFTHALSAYLQDPETFKKILSEIRPTEPPSRFNETNEAFTMTTIIPTTSDDYPSVTKEKDEVLDFSEDVTAPRKPALQTTTELPTPTTDDAAFGYYTTSIASESQYTTETPLPDNINNQNYLNPPVNQANDFASAVNNAFDTTNGIQGFSGPSGPSGATSNEALGDYENYFPSADTDNRENDIQRNSSTTYEPYGKYVKPLDSAPIGDNYVSSTTPATYEQTTMFDNLSNGNGLKPDQLANRNYESVDVESSSEPTTETFDSTTAEPFRIRYYDTTTLKPENPNDETLVTANSIYANYNYNRFTNPESTKLPDETNQPSSSSPNLSTADNTHAFDNYQTSNSPSALTTIDTNENINNHWTSSPVTQLWESTVFVDPKHINQGLTSEAASQTSSLETFGNEPSATTHSSLSRNNELLVTDASSNATPKNTRNPSTPWQWATSNDNDSPTAFTLLPTSYTTEYTATPAPMYTTRSSITTTITSSVISTSTLPHDVLFPTKTRLKNNFPNATENEIVRAKQMFGALNHSSSDTLMRVMKTADKNSTVRQLVLLLISHCTGPMNKTREQEKEHLLNALLSMPVNEFSSDESRDIVAGISRLNLPAVSDLEAHSTTTVLTSTEPIVTTFRSKKSRRIKTNRDDGSGRSDGNKSVRGTKSVDRTNLSDVDVSDGRALELLRSLYTIAAKWG